MNSFFISKLLAVKTEGLGADLPVLGCGSLVVDERERIDELRQKSALEVMKVVDKAGGLT